MTGRLTRLVAVVAATVTASAGLAGLGVSQAMADQVAQPHLVAEVPTSTTPNVLGAPGAGIQVNAIAQVGSRMFIGGTFTQLAAAGTTAPVVPRNYLAAYDASTGVIDTGFLPALNGPVNAIVPATDGASIYVAGSFTTVNGVPSSQVTRLAVTSGGTVAGFHAPTFVRSVLDMHLVRSQLVVAGTFSKVGAVVRGGLASLDPDTGALTNFVHNVFALPRKTAVATAQLQVEKFDVTPNGARIIVIGSFGSVDGAPRQQVALLDSSGGSTVVLPWSTTFYSPFCASSIPMSVRDVAVSPDGTYAVVADSGGPVGGSTSHCDSAARFEVNVNTANIAPSWVDKTGGDTTNVVALSGVAVYVGGHMRWENNPYGSNSAGAGAVPRQGLAALDPATGLPMSWNPGHSRFSGPSAMLVTADGLVVGSDSDTFGYAPTTYTRMKLGFLPLAGGTTPPPGVVGTVPNDVYLLGSPSGAGATLTFGDGARRQFWLGSGAPETPVAVSSSEAWGSTRGAFLIDGTVYYGVSDGTLRARSFDGTTFGSESTVNLNPVGSVGTANSFAADIPRLTGLAYTNHRLYYTLAGDANLYARTFTSESGTVGAVRVVVGGGGLATMNPKRIAGMFASNQTLYFADSTNKALYSVNLAGGGIASPGTVFTAAVVRDTSVDWRARGGFIWSGAPASHPNTPPTAAATASCSLNICSFDGSGSKDTDGHIVSYAWSFGDGGNATGVTTTHAYSAGGAFDATLLVTDNAGGTDSATVHVTPSDPVAGSPFTAVTPCRVFDTRSGTGTCAGIPTPAVAKAKIGQDGSVAVKMTGISTVPSNATAVVLNVTAVNATKPTFVTAWPDGGTRPTVSNLNVLPGAAKPNLVVVPIGSGGQVDFYNHVGTTDVIADLAGYFAPSGASMFAPVTPCRVFDTRNGQGGCSGVKSPEVPVHKLGKGGMVTVKISALGGVPSGSTAVVLNVTATGAAGSTFVSVYPAGATRPLTSNLNVANSRAVPNLVVVPLGTGGAVTFFNNNASVDLVVDLAGYFGPAATSTFRPVGPCRVFDTRTGAGLCPGSSTHDVPKAKVGANATLRVKVTGIAGVPTNATAVVLNVTAADATAGTYVTVFPDGHPRPVVSNLNVYDPWPVPNLVVVPVGAGGFVDFYNHAGTVSLIGDIAGYFGP